LLRRVATALIVIPLAVIIVAFAVANRQMVTVSLDPFSADAPAAVVALPLFALIILLLIIGVLIGGVSAWLRQGPWRSTARRLQREVGELRAKVDRLEGAAAGPAAVADEGNASRRLTLRPPIR